MTTHRRVQIDMRFGEIDVDLFAGGGGASVGIEEATGEPVFCAVNHDAHAIEMHSANHPQTRHHREDVFAVDPVAATTGRPVRLLWASPDCKHFSRAKGGRPREQRIRSLAWVVVDWARAVRPRIICLENVPEFVTWGPLDESTGRPIPERAGETFAEFIDALRACGYRVEWRTLVAADYGAPTTRRRLYLVARCDGKPIAWPEQTHGPGRTPYRTAAECIDWSLPCPSIFDRPKPLALATQRRIAEGLRRYVLDAAEPFIVRYNGAQWRGQRTSEPLTTIDTSNRFGIVAPTMVQTSYGERPGQRPRALDLHAPLGTVVAGGAKHALVAAYVSQYYGNGVVGLDARRPLGTVTTWDHHALVAAHVTKFYGTSTGSSVTAPLPTVTAGGEHLGLVAAPGGAPRPEATRWLRRFGLQSRAMRRHGGLLIADIGMRMLQPRELARAQGFADSYILTGSKTRQIARIGNSVCPPVARALVAAQLGTEIRRAA